MDFSRSFPRSFPEAFKEAGHSEWMGKKSKEAQNRGKDRK
jgi:hypothetical protein